MSRSFIIDQISGSTNDFSINRQTLGQIPYLLTTPGPLSLKVQAEPYKIYKGDKEI